MKFPSRTLGAWLLACGLAGPLTAPAHGPVPRTADADEAKARLFTADSSTGQVIAVDLPGGQVVTRLATPPYVLALALTHDSRYVFAMRGRDTDRDSVTVIDAGVSDTGPLHFPSIVRSYLGNAPGGTHDGFLSTVGGNDAVFNEGVGELQVFGNSNFASLEAIPTRTIKLAAPDHYHYLEAGDFLYVGHLAKGMVQILNRKTGKEVARIEKCPILHGMARDETTGRLFFACMQNVVVVGTRGKEMNRELARIPYPTTQRIGVFVRGKGQVIWGTTEGANPAILRLDAGTEPYAFQAIPVDAAIQRGATEDGGLVLLYSRSGNLEIRDGGSGDLLNTVEISKPFDKEYHEHVDKALLPDIITLGDLAYISIPPEGVIAEVDLKTAKVLRRIEVGGAPTRLVAVRSGGAGDGSGKAPAAAKP